MKNKTKTKRTADDAWELDFSSWDKKREKWNYTKNVIVCALLIGLGVIALSCRENLPSARLGKRAQQKCRPFQKFQ